MPPKNYKPQAPYRRPRLLVTVYKWIEKYIHEHGYAPTPREIVDDGLTSSTSVVNYWLDRMAENNMLRRTPNVARSIVLHDPLSFSDAVREAMTEMENE